jgi:two-component system nitrogen regulation sensor histidine kinase NtrY
MSSADSSSPALNRRATDRAPGRSADLGQAIRRWALRAAVWGRRVRFANILAFVLAGAALVCGIATYLALTGWDPAGPSPRAVLVLLNLDLLLLLGLAVLVVRRLVRLWAAHRSGTAGSRLHVRLAMLFGVVAITPAILMALFSALFFTFGVQSWFSERVRSALNESEAVAKAYLAEHQQVLRGDALAVATDVNRQWPQLSLSGQILNNYLSTQAAFRGLTEAVIFTDDWKVVAKTGYTFDLQAGEPIPLQAIAQANIGQVAIVTGDNADRVRALVRLSTFPTMYLYVGRFVDSKVLGHVSRTGAAVDEYRRLEGSRSDLEISFTLLFSVVALLMLLVAVWFGLTLATRLARPIADLINAAERVRGGDLSVRVRETAEADELAYLSRAFNRMTTRLGEQQARLRDTNAQLDERRRFTETVLDGVSAGVIGLDDAGNMTLPNRSAAVLLGADLTQFIGKPVSAFAPEFAGLLGDMMSDPDRRVLQREIQVARGNTSRTLLVRLSAERGGAQVVGYVFTFDDITALQSAQRKAAWADVARRIAHEIKNPLTPIQLSAERLKRKYRDRLGDDDSGLFAQCTDTIIRHVGDIGQMVDEFSAFARMPAPVLKESDLAAIVREGVGLQRMAFPQIAFALDLPQSPVTMRLDARQVGQAVTNILKNALEAIEGRIAAGDTAPGRIAVVLTAAADGATVAVTDNGVGLPQGERERLTEPYVTNRAKGTGLGLAIVKKVVEDHGGTLELADAPDGQGARVTLHFPAGLVVRSGPERAVG